MPPHQPHPITAQFKAVTKEEANAGKLVVTWRHLPAVKGHRGALPATLRELFYQRGLVEVTAFSPRDPTILTTTYKDTTCRFTGNLATSIHLLALIVPLRLRTEIKPKGKRVTYFCQVDTLRESKASSLAMAFVGAHIAWIRAGCPIAGVSLKAAVTAELAALQQPST